MIRWETQSGAVLCKNDLFLLSINQCLHLKNKWTFHPFIIHSFIRFCAKLIAAAHLTCWHSFCLNGTFRARQKQSSLLDIYYRASISAVMIWSQILCRYGSDNSSKKLFWIMQVVISWRRNVSDTWKEEGGNKLSKLTYCARLAISDLQQAIAQLPTRTHWLQVILITFNHTTLHIYRSKGLK